MRRPVTQTRTLRQRGLRELHLVVADARSAAVRSWIARQVARLDPDHERDALRWIEAVAALDDDDAAR